MGLLDEAKPTPRKNKTAGLLADVVEAIDTFARKPFGYDNPPVQKASDFLGVPGFYRTLDRVSYGEPLTTGSGWATKIRPDTVDALGFVPMAPKTAALGLLGGVDTGAAKAIFAGVNAKTADKAALATAEKMTAAGADPRAIWKETGWMKGGDGKWRFEIDDSKAKNHFTAPDIKELRDMNGGEWIAPNDFMTKYPNTDAAMRMRVNNTMRSESLSNESPSLGMTFPHMSLLDAYPDMYKTRTIMSNKTPVGEGGYAASQDAVVLGPSSGRVADSVMLHELQHAVQQREGFANGGSPKTVREDALKMVRRDVASGAIDDTVRAMQMLPMYQQHVYNRLAGEAEARAVQKRMNLTPEQRRATFPLDSYDVPIDQLIYR